MFVAFHATIFTLGKSSMFVLLSLSQMVVTLRLSPSQPPSSDGDKKNKPTSLAWTQEKPYIDAGDPRVE